VTDNQEIQMVYLSFATRELKSNPDAEIAMILQEAQAHNARMGITGQLIYRGGIFLQLLEGQKSHIDGLLGRILMDNKRHENLKVLLKQPMQERVFPDWSMAYRKLDNVALDLVNSIVPWQKLTRQSQSSGNIKPSDIFKVFEELRA